MRCCFSGSQWDSFGGGGGQRASHEPQSRGCGKKNYKNSGYQWSQAKHEPSPLRICAVHTSLLSESPSVSFLLHFLCLRFSHSRLQTAHQAPHDSISSCVLWHVRGEVGIGGGAMRWHIGGFDSWDWESFCAEFLCVCMGSVRVLWLPPTLQKHALEVNWEFYKSRVTNHFQPELLPGY